MEKVLYLTLAAVALFLIDRLGLWLEDRGYIYYRKKSGSASAMGNAFLEIQSMVDPAAKHVLEMRQDEIGEQDDSGDPPRGDHSAAGDDAPAHGVRGRS
jgi:hypothetical protein